MEYHFTALTLLLLVGAGVFAGFINTIAGGGGMLTVPALMLLGMPVDVANGTSRIAVLTQSLEAVRGFDKYGRLSRADIVPLLAPTLAGGLVGSVIAALLPPAVLKPALLGIMLATAAAMFLWPSLVMPTAGTRPYTLREKPVGALWLFGCGVYGGFAQAGIGFLLIATLGGVFRYDLVRTNALKMALTAAFTVIALAVFIAAGQVAWVPGLVLAASTVLGVQASVRFAVHAKPEVLRRVLFAMVLVACVAAFLK